MTFAHTLCLMAFAGMLAASLPAQAPYKIVDRWKIAGTERWDYISVDPAAHQLFLAHGVALDVIDTTTGKVTGSITGLVHMHGVALDPAGKYGYLSDGGANSVLVFDRKTLAVVKKIPAGINPDCILWEPVTGTVWAFNGRSASVSVIDPATMTVVATIKTPPGKLEFAVADGKGGVYDNVETSSSILHFDAKSRTLVDTWKLKGCEGPSGMAIDKAKGILFSVCDDHMAVVETATGKQVALAAIGGDPDGAAYNEARQLAFASNGEGSLSVVDTAHAYRTIETLPTNKGAGTLGYDPVADRLYVVGALRYGSTPAPTAAVPKPKPSAIEGTTTVFVIGR